MKKSLSAEVVFRLMNLEGFVADRVSTGVGFGSALLGLGIYLQIVFRWGLCCRCFDVSWIYRILRSFL
jgi:hypothetical protein